MNFIVALLGLSVVVAAGELYVFDPLEDVFYRMKKGNVFAGALPDKGVCMPKYLVYEGVSFKFSFNVNCFNYQSKTYLSGFNLTSLIGEEVKVKTRVFNNSIEAKKYFQLHKDRIIGNVAPALYTYQVYISGVLSKYKDSCVTVNLTKGKGDGYYYCDDKFKKIFIDNDCEIKEICMGAWSGCILYELDE